jgi:hypothetical protein
VYRKLCEYHESIEYAKDVRDGKKSRRTPWSEFKRETPTPTVDRAAVPQAAQQQGRCRSATRHRGIEYISRGNFKDLKKLIPIAAAGFCNPWAGLQQMRWRKSEEALEDAHAAADLEGEALEERPGFVM